MSKLMGHDKVSCEVWHTLAKVCLGGEPRVGVEEVTREGGALLADAARAVAFGSDPGEAKQAFVKLCKRHAENKSKASKGGCVREKRKQGVCGCCFREGENGGRKNEHEESHHQGTKRPTLVCEAVNEAEIVPRNPRVVSVGVGREVTQKLFAILVEVLAGVVRVRAGALDHLQSEVERSREKSREVERSRERGKGKISKRRLKEIITPLLVKTAAAYTSM